MNKQTHTVGFIIIISLFMISCGTIMQGTTQEVGISSNPSDARVTINGVSKGNTPMILDLKRKDTHMIKIELEGFETYETSLTRKTSGWVWGNIVFGGIIGLAVDASAGGMYKLTPEQISAELRSSRADFDTNDNDQIFIAVVLKAKPGWKKVGNLSLKN
jgi:hypothetical protein